jgi:hypothetical protein
MTIKCKRCEAVWHVGDDCPVAETCEDLADRAGFDARTIDDIAAECGRRQFDALNAAIAAS